MRFKINTIDQLTDWSKQHFPRGTQAQSLAQQDCRFASDIPKR